MDGIGALVKEAHRVPSPLSPREDTGKSLQPHLAMLAPRPGHPASAIMSNKSLLSMRHPLCSTLL